MKHEQVVAAACHTLLSSNADNSRSNHVEGSDLSTTADSSAAEGRIAGGATIAETIAAVMVQLT